MAGTSYYEKKKKEQENKLQAALKAREQRSASPAKSTPSQTSTSNDSYYAEKKRQMDSRIQTALSSRRTRIQNSLPDVLSDIQKRFTSEVESYNKTSKPAFGSFNQTYASQRDRRRSLNSLRKDILAYKPYMDRDTADSLVSTLDQIKSGYDSYLELSKFETEDDYNTAVRKWGYSQKYQGKSYDELNTILEYMDDGEEKEWIRQYAPTVMDQGDYEKYLLEVKTDIDAENDRLNQLYSQRNSIQQKITGYSRNPSKVGQVKSLREELNQVNAAIKDAEGSLESLKSDQWKMSKEQKYRFLNNESDFAQNSKYVSTESDGLLGEMWSQYGMGYDDLEYEFINNHGDIRNQINQKARSYGADDHKTTSTYQEKHYDLMKEQEVATYNYLYSTQGKDAAKEYLEYLEYTLNERAMGEYAQNAAAFADEHPVISSIYTVPANLMSGVGYMDVLGQNIVKNAKEMFTGEYSGPVDYNRDAMALSVGSSTIRGTVAQNIADATGVIDINPVKNPMWAKILNGKSLGDVYQLGMSMADSAAVAGLTAMGIPGGTYLLAGSAATQGVLDAVSRGATDDQALFMGLLNGVAEWFFEKYEIESILENASDGFIKSTLKSMLSEAVGEGSTTIANTITDAFIMAENSDWQANINMYLSQGMSQEEATKQAFLDALIQVGWDAVGGAAMGGIMGGAASVTHNLLNKADMLPGVNAENKAIYGQSAPELVTEAMEINPDNAYAQRMQGRLDSGKDISGRQITKLVKQNEAAMRSNDIASIESAAANRLTELGETGDVATISKALAKQAAGEKLSKAENQAIADSKYGQRVANELNPENIQSGDYASQWAEGLDTNRINVQEYSRLLQEMEQQEAAETATEEVSAKPQTISKMETVQQEPVAENATTTQQTAAATEESSATGKKSLQIESDQEESTVSLEDASKKYGAQAGAMVHTYQAGQDVAKFDEAYQVAYDMGKSGVDKSYAMNSKTISYLTETQRELAYQAGQAAAEGSTILNETGDTVKVKGIASIQDGKMTLELENGETVNADQVTLSVKEVLLYNAISGMDISAKEANQLLRGYDGSTTTEAYASGISEAYNYGRMGVAYKSIDFRGYAAALPEQVRKNAYQMGRRTLETGKAGSYNNTTSKKEGADNGTGENVHLRGGVQRTDGAGAAGQVQGVESGAGSVQNRQEKTAGQSGTGSQNQGTVEGRVSTRDLGIRGGSESKNLRLFQGEDTADIREAKAVAKENGLKLVLFTGGNLELSYNGEAITARAMIDKDTIYVRADHPDFTAAQLAKHEAGHHKISAGKVDMKKVYADMVEYATEGYVDFVIAAYVAAYATLEGADGAYILEEIICDYEGGMNIFDMEGTPGIARFLEMADMLVEGYSNSETTRGPPADVDAKLSRAERGRSIELETMENNRFERLRQFQDNLPAEWYAFTGGYFYIYSNQSYTDYTILAKVCITNKNRDAINNFTEALENGAYEHSKTFDSWTSHFRRGKGRYTWDSVRNGNRGAAMRSDGVDGRKRGGNNTGDSAKNGGTDQVKFSREETDKAYLDAVESGDMNTAQKMVEQAAKDAGYTVKAYHGTARADRVGTVFRPDRATSGPMAFFTDSKEIASNYARDKADTSLAYDEEYDSYYTQFRVNRNGKSISISELWRYLSMAERARIKEKAQHIRFDENYENIIVDPKAKYGNGAWDAYTLNMHKGNALDALVDTWLETGDLLDREGDFLEVLKLVGVTNAEYRNPDFRAEKVYDTWLKIQNPFDTDNADQSFYDGLSVWIDSNDMSAYQKESSGADMWDKNNQTPESWLEKLDYDIENGTTHAWTSIPDFVTAYLKEQGHDGIKDKGGKGGGEGHTVWIPFSSEQVKSADTVTYDDSGKVIPLSKRFDEAKNDIRFSREFTQEEADEHRKAAVSYFGKTYRWNETGYLLTDGTRLDFSGRHEGGPGGYRSVDHRDIVDALGDDYSGGSYSGGMVNFMQEGNIRISPESGGINLQTAPTKAQEEKLADFISRERGEVILDIDDTEGNTVSSTEYPRGTRSSRVIADIRRYFEDGTKPYVSEVSQFHFSREEGAQRSPAPVFYSQMARVLENVKQEKLGAASVIAMLKGKGVKNEEIKWSGIETFLDGKKSVTKAELQEFLQNSGLEIQSRILNDNRPLYTEEQQKRLDEIQQEFFDLSDEMDDAWQEAYGTFTPDEIILADDQATAIIRYVIGQHGGFTGFEGISSLSKAEMKLYGEIPDAIRRLEMERNDIVDRAKAFKENTSDTRWSRYTLDGGENYQEVIFTMPGSDYTNRAMKAHWGDDAQGILAHARVQDFQHDGKPVLFVEEIQSDWHNSGHKNGYKTTKTLADARAEFDAKKQAFDAADSEYSKALSESNWNPYDALNEPDKYKHLDDLREKRDQALSEMEAVNEEIAAILADTYSDKAPDAPYRNTYHEFALKNLLRMAAEGGYDYLAWTPGWMQEERWSSDYAEGYRIEYDQDIPKFLNKYGRQWGIQTEDIGLDGLKNTTVPAIPVTQAVKDSVLYDGQPKFSREFIQAQMTEKEKQLQKVNKALEKDNAKLQEDNQYLKQLLKLQREVTGGTKFTKSSVETMAKQLKTKANAVGDTKELATILNNFYEFIATSKELSWEDVMEQADVAASWLMEHKREDFVRDEYAQRVLDDLWGRNFYLDDVQKGEAAHAYGSYQAFRQKVFGTVTASDKASMSLDELWKEMSAEHPYYFPSETTGGDQVRGIVDAIDALRTAKAADNTDVFENSREMEKRELLHDVYDSFWMVSTLRTVADSMQKQINNLKYKHYKMMDQVKQAHQEATKQLETEYRQRMDDLRAEYRARTEDKIRKVKEANQQSRANLAENRQKAEMRRKIRRTVMDLWKLLNRGNKNRNVKEDMKNLVSQALKSADILFTDNYSNTDMVRDGVGTELTETEARYMSEAQAILAQIEGAGTVQERMEAESRLQGRLDYRMGKLKDVFIRERARLNKTQVSDVLGGLADAYASLQNSEQGYVIEAYDENVHQYLNMLKEDVGGTIVKNMSLNQLDELHKAYTMVLTTVRNANRMFADNIKQTREQLGSQTINEVKQAGGDRKFRSAAEKLTNSASWNNQKPIYAFERIGSPTLTRLFENTRAGEDTWAQDMTEAREYYLERAKKYRYDSWDFGKQYKFTSNSGMDFSLNLEQIMSLYAYSKRDAAHDHLLKGGFVFDDATEVIVEKAHGIKQTMLLEDATAYNISMEILAEIVSKLTAEQKGFVDEMQDYLSTTMGGKGNAVSMQLYGVKLFNEKYYFPLRSAGQYMEKAQEADLKRKQGQISIVNSGFAKATKPKASNPVVLSGFMDVWAGHVNEMSMYHSFVLPMEDFRRVYNYKSPNMESQAPVSVYGTISNAYGKAAVDYIDQLYRDLNGGAVSDPRETMTKMLMGKFKKAAVFASASVVIQQPSAIGRAFAIIDPKYFIGSKIDSKRHKALWAEVKQYAPVAVIKEMGYFDTGMGKSTEDFLKGKEYHTIKEKAAGLFKDGDYRYELLGKAPALADELTWCAIWEAAKRETKAKNPGMDVKSEAFLKKAGERFTEVIIKTQVYDSVLSRSANMRSKGAAMSMLTAFMAEPTTSINMVEDAWRKAKRGEKGAAAKEIGAVACSVVLNSLLVSLVYAMRDDDDDETFLEKYAQSFAVEMLEGVNPITYYPVLKDIWSLFQGFDIERADMSLFADLADSFIRLVKVYSKDTDSMDEEHLAAHEKSQVDAWWSVADYVAALGGFPLKNLRRDYNGAINMVKTISADLTDRDTSWGSLMDKTLDAVKSSVPVWGWMPGDTAADKLYEATIKGDTAYQKRLESAYETKNALDNAIRKGLRANDSRIWEAAVAWNNNDLEGYMRIAKQIVAEKNFSQDNVVMAIQAEAKAMLDSQSKETESKAKGYFTMDKFSAALSQGNNAMAGMIRDDIIETAQKNGKTAEEAENSFNSSAKSSIMDLFDAGKITKAQTVNSLVSYCGYDKDGAETAFSSAVADDIRDDFDARTISSYDAQNLLVQNCGKTAEEATKKVRYWEFRRDNPDIYADDAWIDEYYDEVESSGIPIDLFVEYRNKVKGITGEGKKDKRMDVIDALPLSSAQKDALYYAEGWAASRIDEAPWH